MVDYLGIKICKVQKEINNLNFTPIIKKIKQKLNSCLMRDLSLKGRILLSKAEGLSRLVYTAFALDVLQSVIKEVDTFLFKFIWKNRPHYLKKTVLCNPIEDGGLNVIDFNTANCVFKNKWIKNYLKLKGKIWNIIPEFIFDKLGGLELFLRCNFDINKVRIKLSSFHKQVCLLWMLIFKHNFSPHKSVIWNNKYIKFKNKSLFYRNWYNNAIILVRQLFKNNGHFFNYCEFLNYYKIPITAKEFAVVFDAISSGLIQLLSGNISSEYIPLYPNQLSINGVKVIDNTFNN